MKNNVRTKRTFIVGVLSFVLYFAVLFMAISPANNYLNMVIDSNEERGGNLLRTPQLTQADGAGSYDLSIPYIGLEKGKYTVDISYTAAQPVDINIHCTSEYDTETKEYPVIFLGTLTPEETSQQFTFSFDRDVKQFMMKIDYSGKGEVTIDSCNITTDYMIYRNREISAAVIALALAVITAAVAYLVLGEDKNKKEKLFCVAVMAAMVVSCSIGLLEHDVMIGDDMEFHLARIMGIAENISHGAPFNKVNLAFNGGYGYLNPAFYPEMFLCIPAVFMVLGASVTFAYRLFIFIFNIINVLVAYYCFGKISKNRMAGLVAAGIYTLNHYRMRDIYARAAVGELLYMTFLPLVIYGIYLIFHKEEEKWPVLMIGATLVFQSHILGTVLTACAGGFIILLYLIWYILKKENIIKPIVAMIKAAVGVVALNLFFLVPMLYYMRQDFSMFGHADYVRLFRSMAQPLHTILFRFNGLGYKELYARFGTTAGVLFAVLFVVAVVYIIKNRNSDSADIVITFVCAAFFLICASEIMPWKALAEIGIVELFMSKMQFCFRFVSLFAVFAAMGVAVLFKALNFKKKNILLMAVAVVLTVSGVCYHFVDGCQTRGFDGDYAVVVDSPPEYFMKNAAYHVDKVSLTKFKTSSDSVVVKDYEKIGGGISFTVENASSQQEWVDIPLLYYAQYRAEEVSDGTPLEINAGERFVIRVAVPQGMSGEIEVTYHYHIVFILAVAVSALSAVVMAAYFFLVRRKKLFTK